MENNFYSDDCGVLIGLVSAPPALGEDDFFKMEIEEELSSHYKADRRKYMLKGEFDVSNILYTPIGYKSFGENSLMFFSLFDDFSYPNRVFHPFHGNRETKDSKKQYQNYDYQLVVGLNTMLREVGWSDSLEKQSLASVFKPKELLQYPFTCVTRFKVNGCFLCGNGLDFTELVKKKIHLLHRADGMHVVVLNGLGGDELILINFANTISELSEFVYKCRNLQIRDLNLPGYGEWYETILKQRVSVEKDKRYVWEEAHVFTSAYSLPGYAIGCNESTCYDMQQEKFDVLFSFSWDIKPGHIKSFLSKFGLLLKDLNLPDGGNIYQMSSSAWRYSIHLKELGKCGVNLFEIMNALRNFDLERSNTRKLHTSISVNDTTANILEEVSKEIKIEDHPNSRVLVEEYFYDGDFLRNLRRGLDKSKISKVLKERIMKMYHNYNDCIQDPVFFVSFIELRHFLDSFSSVVLSYANRLTSYASKEMHEWMDNSVRDFEHAYLNRFHQSSRMRTLSDFNLEWNGGIQQLISSMDFTYKTFMHVCGMGKLNKFMYVSGYERVHVTDHSYRINMQHITYPELFVSTIWKELFNFLLTEGTKKDKKDSVPLKELCSDNFVYDLKNRVSLHYEFNKENAVCKTFLDLIDNEYIVSVIADTLSFYYGYNQNYDNFSYWYWRHLMQSSLYHELDGKLNKERFIMFLGRVLFIYVLSGKNGDDLRLKPFDSCLSEYWMLYFEDVYSVVRILDEILDKKDFKRTMIGFSNKLFFTSYPQIVEFMNEKTGGDKQVVMAKMPILVKDIREKYVEKFMDDFSSNRLPLDKCEFPCNFIGSFLPSFLCYLKALNEQGCNTDVAQMLQRDENGKPDLAADEADCYSNILVDSFGGTFCIHGEVQRKYFAARSVFYMTIFHFCEKNIISTIKVGKS